MTRILKTLLALAITGCATTRPPTLEAFEARPRSLAPGNPYDEVENLVNSHFPESHSSSTERAPTSRPFLAQNPIQLGMHKKNVQVSLGSPNEVEVAGHPKYGNERWTYEETMTTVNGYLTTTKRVYFENHQVVGWEIN